VQVPTLIDYTKVPRRYRSLLYKLYSWGDGRGLNCSGAETSTRSCRRSSLR